AADPNTGRWGLWCGSCHEPHGSLRKGLLVVDPGKSFCGRCHTK
ncbi:MAG: cytochrome c3 family protein, partial [Acidobacteriota bacterium]